MGGARWCSFLFPNYSGTVMTAALRRLSSVSKKTRAGGLAGENAPSRGPPEKGVKWEPFLASCYNLVGTVLGRFMIFGARWKLGLL